MSYKELCKVPGNRTRQRAFEDLNNTSCRCNSELQANTLCEVSCYEIFSSLPATHPFINSFVYLFLPY